MSERGMRKTRTGTVVSAKSNKTITVLIERLVRHPLYGKVVKRNAKLMAHDENNEARIGDIVEVMETRPISRTKRWRLSRMVERAK